MKILLLSAYDAQSHQYWRRQLVAQFPEHQWTVLTLPARYFSWRIRGNSLSWAFGPEAQTLRQHYDLVIATSMTDLSALKGMVPELASTRCVLYVHENQFAYPNSGRAQQSVEPQILNIYSALAADSLLFNSRYNLATFVQGTKALLKKLPDAVPAGIGDIIEQRSQVLPVPLAKQCYLPHQPQPNSPLQIVWNHRWEYDKGPDILLACMQECQRQALPVRFHIVGQQFRNQPEAFAQMAQLGEMLGEFGYLESADAYRQLLQRSDLVLSTAIHDFQGIAVLEAVAAGCIPLLPDRLAYQELFAPEYRYPEGESEHLAIVERLALLAAQKQQGKLAPAPSVEALSWQSLRPGYQQVLES